MIVNANCHRAAIVASVIRAVYRRPRRPGGEAMQAGVQSAAMRTLVSCTCAALALMLMPRPALAQTPDWKQIESEALGTLQTYVRINTSNPPGDVTKAADFLVDLLKREGIDVKRFESGPGRSIVVARLKGSGSGAKALLLEHHMDVVAADA